MNTFSNAFRAEVIRMARKELKPELQSLRKIITSHRSEIAALKREVKALASQLKSAHRVVSKAGATKAPAPVEADQPKQAAGGDFSAQAFADKRSELGITQKQMAQLVGASWLSVYKWESGKVHPRAAQMDRISKVLKLSKRKALALLSQD
ncbi:helix-turn-helix domain-containing protein (plasmid) [Acidovorax sp. DW039]|uniref:helix-turn-helix transcriptional regulator n=1 Tax=Acidovorax sp. DW039 TaxID=3095606 RepID=UPI00308DF822|nr:helix-turn-helix domain-containing protein [Acidovorax sp. DW039]